MLNLWIRQLNSLLHDTKAENLQIIVMDVQPKKNYGNPMGWAYRSISITNLLTKSLILKCKCTQAPLIGFDNSDRLSLWQFGDRVCISDVVYKCTQAS